MPWNVREKVELRLEFVRRMRQGESIAALCREYEISRPTGYLWLNRFKAHGTISSLWDRSHATKSCSHKTQQDIESRVVELRNEYGWGAAKLKVLLQRQHNITLPRITINRIIERNGLLVLEDCHRAALKRFERARPNELWQVDMKGCIGRGEARCEPLSMLDDHSRYVVGLFPTRTSKLEPIQEAFLAVFKQYGVPEGLLMDHGCPWWGTAHFSGLTRLSVWLMRQDIKLHFSGYSHPQTQGKVERFHRTLAQAIRHKGTPTQFEQWESLLSEIQKEYNVIRPHESLGMEVPASRYSPSSRQFNPSPSPIEYPDGFTIQKVDSLGRFRFKGHRLFSSQALAGEYVGLKWLENSMVIYYRKTPMREVDLSTGTSIPLSNP